MDYKELTPGQKDNIERGIVKQAEADALIKEFQSVVGLATEEEAVAEATKAQALVDAYGEPVLSAGQRKKIITGMVNGIEQEHARVAFRDKAGEDVDLGAAEDKLNKIRSLADEHLKA